MNTNCDLCFLVINYCASGCARVTLQCDVRGSVSVWRFLDV